MTKIVWSDPAAADLTAIHDYIAKGSPSYAKIFVERVFQGVESLAPFPHLGRAVPEYARQNVRQILVQGYRIIYRLDPDHILIGAIIHGSRQLVRITL